MRRSRSTNPSSADSAADRPQAAADAAAALVARE
jgi:hypothetical protein